jgi:hypothetical protein
MGRRAIDEDGNTAQAIATSESRRTLEIPAEVSLATTCNPLSFCTYVFYALDIASSLLMYHVGKELRVLVIEGRFGGLLENLTM